MSHPHQGLPATPNEIGAVLDLLDTLATELLKVEQDAAYQTTGMVLRGLVDGFEGSGTSPTTPAGADLWATGVQVAQSLSRGGTRHL